jgi:hypothetical protein
MKCCFSKGENVETMRCTDSYSKPAMEVAMKNEGAGEVVLRSLAKKLV